jgi:hypothetical protein
VTACGSGSGGKLYSADGAGGKTGGDLQVLQLQRAELRALVLVTVRPHELAADEPQIRA